MEHRMKTWSHLGYLFAFFGLITANASAQSGIISTYAGPQSPVNGALATTQEIDLPDAVVADGVGGFYVSSSSQNRVYRVSANGVLTLWAGVGTAGYSGDGGPATGAQLSGPGGVALDAAGNLFIADSGNFSIRKVTPAGIISTVAGNGSSGFSGDGGPATAAQLRPLGVAVDTAGNLFIADTGNSRVRKVTPAGIISTVAGTGISGFSGDGGPATAAQLVSPGGMSVDAAGNLFIADSGNSRIRKVNPAGIISTVAGIGINGYNGDGGQATTAQVSRPDGVAVDAAGNLFIADSGNNRIRKVTPDGIISTVAGNGIFVGPGSPNGFGGDGGLATAAQLNDPSGVAVDAAGNLFIADFLQARIRKVTPDGIISTVAGTSISGLGDGGPATAAQLFEPQGVAVDAAGNLFIADTGNSRIRKVTPAGTITTVAGSSNLGFGDGGPATAARLAGPVGVAVDAAGNLFIADSLNSRIREVTPDGIISTVAGTGINGFNGDGGPATAAQLFEPQGVAVDAAGNLFIADSGNNRIRKVTPDGVISTVAGTGINGFNGDGGQATAAQMNQPEGVAVDAAGNVFIVDRYNNRIRKVTPAGIISTVAGMGSAGFSGDGGPATAAQLFEPQGVAVDAAGNLFISDWGHSRIRKVNPAGIISTVAGNGSSGFSGDGGPATAAQLYSPEGVAVDAGGNLFIADTANYRIRKVTPSVISNLPRTGGFAQVASGAGWSTSMVLTNLSATTVNAQLNFYSDSGASMTLPVSFPDSNTASTVSSSVNLSIAPNQSVALLTASEGAVISVGWADVLSSGPLEGYSVFRFKPTSSEGTVQFDTRLSSALVLPYDNTNGSHTGVAVANQSSVPTTLTVLLLDQGGSQLASSQMPLPAFGHTSFYITNQFPRAANQIGMIKFQNPSGDVTGTGLLFYPGGSFTSLPIIQ
jgi:sugar lactone lactonase YvrE